MLELELGRQGVRRLAVAASVMTRESRARVPNNNLLIYGGK